MCETLAKFVGSDEEGRDSLGSAGTMCDLTVFFSKQFALSPCPLSCVTNNQLQRRKSCRADPRCERGAGSQGCQGGPEMFYSWG